MKLPKDYLLSDLLSPARTEKDVGLRIAKVDYLGYRLGWDRKIKKKIESFLRTPLEDHLSKRQKATMIAERAELIGRMARYDWSAAEKIIQEQESSLLKNLALYESYHNMIGAGIGSEYAMDLVKSVDEHFNSKVDGKGGV